jgi:hypothetical protein
VFLAGEGFFGAAGDHGALNFCGERKGESEDLGGNVVAKLIAPNLANTSFPPVRN